ncbi:histidine phosphatase family protein [Beduinella massiliensis]|uniref:histidine phosphatase family protein n=1 Tax=Beduinella massiliensis TaxID=1852363 RepID=UPI0031F7E90F
MKILIIRHAEPDYARDSLTEKGFREAELLSARLCRMSIRDFFVSPLGRAQATAAPTLARLGREAEVLPWLREFHGRVVNPKTGEPNIPWNLMPQYWTKQPELFSLDTWADEGLMRTGDAGEVYAQAACGLDELLARYGFKRQGLIYACGQNTADTIALFCHFALGMALVSHLTGISPVLLWQGMFLPASSVTTFVSEERKKGEVVFRCMQLGDTSHLYAGGEDVSRAGLYDEVHEALPSEILQSTGR